MKRKTQPTVAIVGTGNVARAIAVGLHHAGVRVTEIIGRDAKKTSKLARVVKALASNLSNATIAADIVWICVSDAAISEVATRLAKLPVTWKRKTVLHASGPLTSAELTPLKKRGANSASFHPMNTFVPGLPAELEQARLRRTPFGAEGDAHAINAATMIANALSHPTPALIFRIRPKDKVKYHAVGAFTSPLLVSTLNIAEQLARSTGIKEPRHLMTPILLYTITNIITRGTENAFSGPIRRGDVATVQKHLAALKNIPNAEAVYRALAFNAVEHLPSKNQAELRKLLKKKK